MELLKQIKKDRMTARKEGDAVKTTLLTTIVGEAETALKGKQASKFSTIALVKKFLKGLGEVAEAREEAGEAQHLTKTEFAEMAILMSYLPQTMDAEATEAVINDFSLNQPMGKIMGQLKLKYGQSIDMGLARKIIESKQ